MTRTELTTRIKETGSFLCVGLDTDLEKLPNHLSNDLAGMLEFNRSIIDATLPYCVSYKINSAFYEAYGAEGWQIMQETFNYIPNTHLKIADAKRGDIGNTSHRYAKAFFETLGADAVTVAPYMGEDSIRPFLEYAGKWTIVLGLTSNAGSANFQRLKLDGSEEGFSLVPNIVRGERSQLLYEKVLETVAQWGSEENLMFVIGATQASELENVRSIVPNHFLLVPGVGAQGGSLAEVARYGLNADCGLLVNASRAVIYASAGTDYAEAAASVAIAYRDEMQEYLKVKMV
jgi:orotidine-5'-phosphate decarboxylase